MKLCYLDIETTGLDPQRNSIIEAAFENPEGNIAYATMCRPLPGTTIQPKALEVNGWTIERLDRLETGFLAGMSEFFDHLREAFPDGAVVCGLNPASLDVPFLRHAWVAIGRPVEKFPLSHRVIDLHTLAYVYAALLGQQLPARGVRCDEISGMLDLPPEPRPHSAANGVRWTRRVHEELMFRIAALKADAESSVSDLTQPSPSC